MHAPTGRCSPDVYGISWDFMGFNWKPGHSIGAARKSPPNFRRRMNVAAPRLSYHTNSQSYPQYLDSESGSLLVCSRLCCDNTTRQQSHRWPEGGLSTPDSGVSVWEIMGQPWRFGQRQMGSHGQDETARLGTSIGGGPAGAVGTAALAATPPSPRLPLIGNGLGGRRGRGWPGPAGSGRREKHAGPDDL